MHEIPYPGLRPFTRVEAHLFFGRDEQIDQLLDKLAYTRFIAVTGLSGSGKSSLVRAGLLANLEFGYMVEAGQEWCILTMRPGMAPLPNLAQALVKVQAQDADPQAVERMTQRLASGGHLECVRILREMPPAGRRPNVVLLVDQFEELFRYERQSGLEERRFFVETLLTSAEQREIPLYVVITLRSDWLGQCARFRGLPEVINAGQFLVPRLTREQLCLAITAPAQVVDGSIDDRLALRLLEEAEHNSDQLPVLQHCLMRMWYYTRKRSRKTKGKVLPPSMTMHDYEAVGGLENALSNHADEAFNSLKSEQQCIPNLCFVVLVKVVLLSVTYVIQPLSMKLHLSQGSLLLK